MGKGLKERQGLPPGPRGSKFLELIRLSRDPLGYLRRCRDRFGDLFTLRIPSQPPQVVICKSADARELLQTGYAEAERHLDLLRIFVGDESVLHQNGDVHRETRRLLHPPFLGERMRNYGPEMAATTDEIVSTWKDGEVRLMTDDMQKVTLGIFLRNIFGVEDPQRAAVLYRVIPELLDGVFRPLILGAAAIFSPSRVREYLRRKGVRDRRPSRWQLQGLADRMATVDGALFDEIDRCRRLPEAERARRSDILSLLVGLRSPDGSEMSNEVLRHQILTLLMAGYETTAKTLCWALECALAHPGTFERMREEVDTVMGDRIDGGRVKQLEYVGAVIDESMRLYPIPLAIPRVVKGPMQIGSWSFPAGTYFGACNYLVQRDPDVWEDPDAFRPERFLAGKPRSHEFFPFGSGVWRCLGAQFAEFQMRVVLARLVSTLDIRVAEGRKIGPPVLRGAITPKDGLPVHVSPRASVPGALRSVS